MELINQESIEILEPNIEVGYEQTLYFCVEDNLLNEREVMITINLN